MTETAAISPEELALIHQYTRRPMAAEELYTFSVVLCDNEVDRDQERFTAEALRQLATLFLGKTGIFNHSAKTEHQAARIYDTYLEEDTERTTAGGEIYTRLIAKAYLPRSEQTAQLILEIDSGIKKEVSVGCAMQKRSCSICGADRSSGCAHRKGEVYTVNGRQERAHDVLSEPLDAYEWSFVAVPAQKEAGVIKAFACDGSGRMQIEKLFCGQEVSLSKEAAMQLKQHLQQLEQRAAAGDRYRDALTAEVTKLHHLVQPAVPYEVAGRMLAQASLADLEALQLAYRKEAQQHYPLQPQLWHGAETEAHTNENQVFQI